MLQNANEGRAGRREGGKERGRRERVRGNVYVCKRDSEKERTRERDM